MEISRPHPLLASIAATATFFHEPPGSEARAACRLILVIGPCRKDVGILTRLVPVELVLWSFGKDVARSPRQAPLSNAAPTFKMLLLKRGGALLSKDAS